MRDTGILSQFAPGFTESRRPTEQSKEIPLIIVDRGLEASVRETNIVEVDGIDRRRPPVACAVHVPIVRRIRIEGYVGHEAPCEALPRQVCWIAAESERPVRLGVCEGSGVGLLR